MYMQVGPWTVQVVMTPPDDLEGDYGDWNCHSKTIRVRSDLSGLEMAMTLIHETFHALSDLHHLRLTEQSVRALENSITQLIQQHSDLAQLLLDSIRHDSDPRHHPPYRAPWGVPQARPEPDSADPGDSFSPLPSRMGVEEMDSPEVLMDQLAQLLGLQRGESRVPLLPEDEMRQQRSASTPRAYRSLNPGIPGGGGAGPRAL